MAITAFDGPILAFGVIASTAPSDYNSQRAPGSITDLGDAMLDPRAYYGYNPGQGVNRKIYGFYNNQGVVDAVLSSGSTNALFTNSSVAAGGTLTLTPSTAKGTATTTIIAPETGNSVSVACIGSTAVSLAFGSDATVNLWNPAAIVGRCISITPSCGVSDGGTWSIAGRDIYGFKMTETVVTSTSSTGTTVNSQKAYKYISSIIACTTFVSTGVIVGVTDTIGFPMVSLNNGSVTTVVSIVSSNSSASGIVSLSTTSFVPGSTATATSTTPDVRGTYASTTGTNGTLRFQVTVVPSVGAVQLAAPSTGATIDYSGIYGVTQYSSV